MVRLIYDSAITGHHSEYIYHLVKYLSEFHSEDVYYFVVSEELKIAFPEIISESEGCSSIVWEFIPQSVIKKIHNLSLLKRSFAEMELVEQYASKFFAAEVFLLYFNIFQLALIFKRPSIKLKGILFLQFLRMEKATLKDKLKYYRKYLITKWYTINPKITTVFILNDQKTVDYLNNEFRTNIFKMLPDPIPVYNEEKGFQIHEYYNIPINKKILLHVGSIDPRKGTYEIIDSVDLLSDKENEEYAILIVGKAKFDIQNIIREKLSALKNINFTIVFDNTFVSNERLKSLFLQSYAVLMPYKNVEASSGIMGHAAIANKCILAPDSGLIGEIIKQYKLGILINKPIAIDIAEGIKRLGGYSNDKILSGNFTSQHTVRVFTRSLLN